MNEIRDPVHGYIHLDDHMLNIVNTPIFQRLRRIKQLAMAYLAYPSANHTRFEHSLGVYHIASLMYKNLFQNNTDDYKKRIVLSAALLHDIGHGPFSHVSEHILVKYSKLSEKVTNSPHELISQRIIENNPDFEGLLSESDRTDIVKLLSDNPTEHQEYCEIVSGRLDADKIDYLLRDSYFCGVKYGIFDIERLLNTLIIYDDYKKKHIGIKSEGINALEQFVLAKYYMMNQVYRHKVRKVTDAMIKRGIELGIEKDELPFLKKLYTYEDSDEYLNYYTSYCDQKVIYEILNQKNGYAKDIFNRLQNRNLFKRVFRRNVNHLDVKLMLKDKLAGIVKIHELNNRLKQQLENEIAELLSSFKVPREYIIVNIFKAEDISSYVKSNYVKDDYVEGDYVEGTIMVVREENNIEPIVHFGDESAIFNSIDKKEPDYFIEIYVPTDDNTQVLIKNELCEDNIIKLIKKIITDMEV